ncbi:hypothetical protein P154DRAFT_525777 [Amniculicola lignicola CBS 123094]|uniref:Luciferase domain-containing protein n=1 Tax=Amniculicola lignicola CBS 123094 TaxID=1392246 RepID=A0A6A5W559_9PLEO|nr:hypothetical protein P154DRAFT_525777 [Amniculicola lignicola CBS 123094]
MALSAQEWDARQLYQLTAVLASGMILALAVDDYQTFISYGPGGLPHNVIGWIGARVLALVSREQLSPSIYDNKSLPYADEPGCLLPGFPPRRTPPRPQLGKHVVPQRQLQQLPGADIKAKFIERYSQLGEQAQAKGLVELRKSVLEREHTAFFVSPAVKGNTIVEDTKGEFSHVHTGIDATCHVILHPSDCKAVLEAGWGQRHGLAGVTLLKKIAGVSLPVTYILIYAPRTEAEVEVVLTIVEASISFMTRTRQELE